MKKNKIIRYAIPFLAICVWVTSCEKRELPHGVLAEVGDTQITVDDFKRAYIPILLYSDKKENEATREEVLNFLIDQAILADEARSLELDTIQTLDVLERTAKKTAFTRILYHDWVKDHIPTPDEEELRRAFKQSHTSLLVRHLFWEDEGEALRTYAELQNGANWDSVATSTFKESSLAANGGLLGWIKFGEMDPDFEQAAYALDPGERSSPVKTQFGWHIIQVDERESKVILTEYDYSLQRSQLKRIIRERHQQRIADSVITDLMDRANLVFQPDIAPRVWTVMQEQIRGMLGTEDFQEMINPELASFEDKLEPIMNEEMLQFSDTHWAVKDFLEKLPEMNRQLMLTDLKKATAFLIRDEILYNEGIRQGLDALPEVKAEVKDRKNQFLANLYLRYQATNRPVSTTTISNFYKQYASVRYQAPDSLYVYELQFETEAQALEFKESLHPEADIQQIRSALMDNTQLIDLGWFQGARNDRVDYYHKLLNLPINTLVGPFQNNLGAQLIIATQRRRHALPLEQIYELVQQDAQEDSNNKLRLREVQRLSEDLLIKIDRSKFDELNLRNQTY